MKETSLSIAADSFYLFKKLSSLKSATLLDASVDFHSSALFIIEGMFFNFLSLISTGRSSPPTGVLWDVNGGLKA